MQKKETIIIAIAAVLIVLLGVGVFYFYRQHEEQKNWPGSTKRRWRTSTRSSPCNMTN